MKIWIKLLAGSIIGLLLGLFLPTRESVYEAFSYLSNLFLNIGRYAIFPLVFFALAVGTFELRSEKKALRVYGRTLLYMIAAAALLSLIGAISVLIMAPDRIPIVIEEELAFDRPDIKKILLQVFPGNLFEVFGQNGGYLLPVYFLAFFLGLNFTFDRLVTRPAVQFFDSMARIFYHINTFMVETLGVGMIALSAFLVQQAVGAPEIGLYRQLLLVLAIDTVLVLFGLYPGLLYLLLEKKNPYRLLYATLGPAIAGFVSGDAYFSLGFLIRNGKENLGVPRKVGSTTFPLFALFGKAGTAMVSAVSFIIIINSYSSLGITVLDFFWVVLFSFLVSFTLGGVPGAGAFVALSTLCAAYGGGYEEGYLILAPVAAILVSVAVLLDVTTASFASLLVARHEKMQDEVNTRDLI